MVGDQKVGPLLHLKHRLLALSSHANVQTADTCQDSDSGISDLNDFFKDADRRMRMSYRRMLVSLAGTPVFPDCQPTAWHLSQTAKLQPQ